MRRDSLFAAMATPPASIFSQPQRHPGVAVAVLLGHVALLYVLLTSGAVRLPLVAAPSLVVVDLEPPPRAVAEPKPSSASPVKRHHEDAPKARRANPTEIVAPRIVVPVPPPPILAAPAPATASRRRQGRRASRGRAPVRAAKVSVAGAAAKVRAMGRRSFRRNGSRERSGIRTIRPI